MTKTPILIYEDDTGFIRSHDHKRECDKCLEPSSPLVAVPFIYLDCNDKVHMDVRPPYNYRQYRVCQKCWERGV